MADIFAVVPTDLVESDPLKIYAEKFGDGTQIDVAKLAKAKHESDTFIETLKRENEEMRKEVASKATIDEILTQIRSAAPKPPVVEPSPTPPNPNPATPEDIEKTVTALLEQKKSEERIKSNRQLVEEKVLEKWGADAALNINKKAKELGVSVDHLQKIALETPSVFFALVGLDKAPEKSAPVVAPRPGMQPPAQPGTDGKRTRAYYEALKQRNPTEYFSAKIRQQEMKDALALGAAYFDV